MKKSLLMLFIISLLLLVAACGATDTTTEEVRAEPAVENESTEAVQEEVPETRIVKDAQGEVELPYEVNDVISLSAQFTDHLLSLDIVPVGNIAGESGQEVSWLHERLNGTTYIGHMQAPEIEMMLDLKPDVILAVEKHHGKAADNLKAVAPTIFLKDMEQDWRELFRYVAEVTNRQELAEERLKQFDNRLAELSSKLPESVKEESVMFLRIHHKESRLFGADSHVGKIAYDQLGLKYPENAPQIEMEMPLTIETIPDFNPDHIFVFDTAKDKNVEALNDLQNHPMWKQTKAVQEGNVYFLGDLNDSKAGKGLVLYNLVVDEIEKALLK